MEAVTSWNETTLENGLKMNKEEITRKARKILIKNRHRKKNPLSSFAFRTSMILTMVLVVVVTLLSLFFLNIIQIAITDNENRELKTHNGVLRGSFETDHEIFFIPYYISYIVFPSKTITPQAFYCGVLVL